MDIKQAQRMAEKQLAMVAKINSEHAAFVGRMVKEGKLPEVLDASAYDESLALLGEFLHENRTGE